MPQTANVAIVAAIRMHESVPTLINCAYASDRTTLLTPAIFRNSQPAASPMSVSSDTMPPELPSINISWPNSMPR